MNLPEKFSRIKKIHQKMTDQFWRAKQRYIRYYETLPLDETAILLESEHGKKINGNIFYIIRYLSGSERYAGYKIYLSSMGRYQKKFQAFLQQHGIENVNITMLASDEYMRLLSSAKYLINDTSFGPYFIKKEGQVYFNTWHGTPLKAMGRQDQGGYASIGNIQKNFAASDYLLYPNRFMQEHMVRDYMLQNICKGHVLLSGYPRNEVFFDLTGRETLREELELSGKRVYACLPTWRDSRKNSQKSHVYMQYYLFEIDRQLNGDEVFYVNLHPLAKSGIDFKAYEHIRPFPEKYETYEFLNLADALITDYSSVFFDFAVTRRKIILFPYDEKEYLADRGMYLDLHELPFPRVYSVNALLSELRSEKKYDDAPFLRRFCPYENSQASKMLCDRVILGEDTGITEESMPDNGKENVFIYTGNLAANGITTSLRSLLNTVDLTERNYYLTFVQEKIKRNEPALKQFPAGVSYYATTGDMNLTIPDRITRKLFKIRLIPAKRYMQYMGKRVRQDFKRSFGDVRADTVIQFNGYEQEVILQFSTFSGRNIIFVHNDMLQEIKTKKNQRLDVLRYAYQHYDRVAVVTEDLYKSTSAIAGEKGNIKVVKNTIGYRSVLEKSGADLKLEPCTSCSVAEERLYEILKSDSAKFISIGRFAPEKGHIRLVQAFYRLWKENRDIRLIIMGGYSLNRCYEELIELIHTLGLEDYVILLMKVPNPFPILKACDYFVLSSFYEGFGLVLAEADILGKPVISTDITGPRGFMKQNHGTLVEDSEDGLYQGMASMLRGKIAPMNVDYEAYNQEAVAEFEKLFNLSQ